MALQFGVGVSRKALLISGIAAGALCAPAAFAQDAEEEAKVASVEKDEDAKAIIVVGSRQAIETALDVKRNADTVVDSITATDIGAFPDKSVAEALQRVAGVTVTRSSYKDDSTHYGAEPSQVLIRGLQQVRSEFNGRDSFSATSGYGLNFSDVAPELLAGVDSYKNNTAQMIEGGIAGTVNIRTRLPFDQPGQLITGTIGGVHNDLTDSVTPKVSGLYSNRWSTEVGEFGLLAGIAYSDVDTVSQGTTLLRPLIFPEGVYTDSENYIPAGMTVGRTDYDRERIGISLAGQWESPSGAVKVTAQYNSSSYENSWNENAVLTYWQYVDPATNTHSTLFTDPTALAPPEGGDPFVFDNNGLFQSGVITGSRGGWGYGLIDWSTNPLEYVPGSSDNVAGTYSRFGFDEPVFEICLPPLNNDMPCRAGSLMNMQTRYNKEKRTINDASFQVELNPTDNFRALIDFQHVEARTDQYDITFNMRTFADIGLDLTGDYPQMTLLRPSGYNLMPGDEPFADYRNYSNDSAMDHRVDSDGTLDALRIDMEYEFDSPWLDDISFGGRYANREQEHKWSVYNWASISADWGTNPVDSWFLDSPATFNDDGSIRFEGYEPGYWETREFGGGILDGNVLSPGSFVFLNRDVIQDPDATADLFSVDGQTDEGGVASSTWNPICSRPDELEDSCYTAGEILNVQEETLSAYAMLRFGGPAASIGGGVTVKGNLGVRVVETTLSSAGALNFAQPFTTAALECNPLSQAEIDALPANAYPISVGCLAAGSTADQAFSSGGSVQSTVNTSHFNVLPSLNVRLDLQDGWFLRFAASRAISKPDIGLLRNFVTLNRIFVPQSEITTDNPNVITDDAGNAVGYNYSYTASSGNPRLKPIRADQFDLSLEYYSDTFGSFSAALFYKKFKDYIQNGTFVAEITNDGVTREVVVTGPTNGDGASIKGFELSYQGFFDFLPSPLDGLGVQANYTYLDNAGVTNSNLLLDTSGGAVTSTAALVGNINPGVLENLSKHSYNAILLYEKARFGARLAYNWRSRYLSSVNDCCVGFPVWTKAQGFLDGSIRFAVTDNVELSLQGSNLLNTKTKLQAQIKGATDIDPNQSPQFVDTSYYESGRRVEFGLRFKF